MSSHIQRADVAILGAGLTGMSAALALQQRGVAVRVLEQEARAGGLCTTDEEQGYRFDRTGHLLHLTQPDRRASILALLDEPPISFNRRSVIFSEGTYTKYPYQSNTFGLPPQTAYECLIDFVRAHTTFPKPTPNNFEEYCRVHFGNAISERFMLPYNGRLWGVAPREITTEWCDRFVPIPTLEDVLAGAVGAQSRELGYNATGYYPRLGIGELASALARRIQGLELNAKVLRVTPQSRSCEHRAGRLEYRALISTLPLPALLSLIADVPAPVAAAQAALRSAELHYLDIALTTTPRRDFHWAYVPEPRFDFYRVGNYAAFSPDMAPPGKACLYVELSTRPAPPIATLVPRVTSQLLEMGLLRSAAEIAFCRLRHVPYAYVIYDEPRRQALRTIQTYLDSLGIVTAGRYGAWNYSSMEDALSFGDQAAKRALSLLA